MVSWGDVWDTAKDVGAGVLGGAGGYVLSRYGKDIKDAALIDPEAAKYEHGDVLRRRAFSQFSQATRGHTAPQADRTQVGNVSRLDQSRSDEWRKQQMALANRLTGIASGQQQGAGELAVGRQVNRALAAQQAQARMARGSNAGIAARAGARGAADVTLAGAGQAREAALADQMAANQALAGVAQGARGQDLEAATQNMSAENQRIFQQAGLDQATSLANMQARLQQAGMDQQSALQYLAMLYGMDQAEMAARVGQDVAQAQQVGGIIGAGGQLAGQFAMASDRRLKRDVKRNARDVDEMLDALKPQRYRYKDEKHGKGEVHGIMAQDLEKSRAGRALVVELPEGKHVDVKKAVSAALAASARLNERVRELEGRSKR